MKAARYSDTQKRMYWIGVGIALRHRNATKEFADGLDDALYNSLSAGVTWGLKNTPRIKQRGQRK